MDDFPKHIIEEEFIMRLPVKSLMKFKCVSKDWNNFISDDRFRRNYLSRQYGKSNAAPTGYICQYGSRRKPLIDKEFLYTSESHVEEEQVKSVLDFLHSFEVLAVSKGLLLIGNNNIDRTILHIYDLVSKQHFILPRIHKERPLLYKYEINFGFNCVEEEETTTTTIHHRRFHYKFVYIEDYKRHPDSSYSTWIFSSKTGTWNQSIMKAKSNFLLSMPDTARVIRGVFHWRCLRSRHIIAHDPDHLNGRTAVLINVPPELKFFDSNLLQVTKDGYLQYINTKKMSIVIEVWILDTGKRSYMDESIVDVTKWVLTSSVSFWDIFNRFRNLEKKPTHYVFGVDPANADILYLRIENKLYAYNHLEKIIVFKCSQSIATGIGFVHYFEWPTWPSL